MTYLDSRDLEQELQELEESVNCEDGQERLNKLRALKEECEGYGWEDGILFIPDYEFEDYAEELFDECYAHDIPNNLKGYIDYKTFARDLEMDYSEVEFDGTTYFWREA